MADFTAFEPQEYCTSLRLKLLNLKTNVPCPCRESIAKNVTHGNCAFLITVSPGYRSAAQSVTVEQDFVWPTALGAPPPACQKVQRLCMSYTILIADDSPFIRVLCNVFEREENFDVCGEAANGREAVEKAQELNPDLILLDLSMPVMNGLDATRLLKRMSASHHVQRVQRFDDRESSPLRRRVRSRLKV